MNCNEFLSLLPLYPDAMQNADTLAAFRAHAAECPDCAKHLAGQEALLRSLHTLDGDLLIPDAFCEGWRARVRDEATGKPPRARHFTQWIAAAAAILVVVGGTALMRGGYLFPFPGMEPAPLYEPLPAAEKEPMAFQYMSDVASDFAEEAESGAMTRGGMNVGALDGGQPKKAAEESAVQRPVILRSASVYLESEAYDQDLSAIEALLTDVGGWIEYRSSSGEPLSDRAGSGRYAYLTLRVPTDSLDAFIKSASAIGRLTGSDMTSEDISENYYDTKGRLSMYESQRDRLSELMEGAQSVSDIIEIEARLGDVQYMIESLVGRLNNWNSRSQSAVVSISVTEVAPEGKYARASFGGRIRLALTESFRAAKAFFADALVFLVMAAPYALLLAALSLITYFVISARKNSRRRKQI